MPIKMCRIVPSLISLLAASTANAATITHAKLDATTEIIRIEGDIVSGDLEQFRQISLRFPNAVVSLNSNGGLIFPAIEIGKIIKIMGYVTMVSDRYVCASACALIWMAGSRRLASSRGNVGFHASYRTDNGRPVESGAANALIGNYLTLLGASARTVVFATTAPPDKVLWLTAANKEASGIDFETIETNLRQNTTSRQGPLLVTTASPPTHATTPQAPATPSQSNLPTELPKNWLWSNAPTAPWVLISTNSDGGVYYINQNTFKPYTYSGYGWEFWTKVQYPTSRITKNRNVLSLTQISCENNMIRSKSFTEFNSDGEVINTVTDDSYSSNKLVPITPNSMGSAFHRSVCRPPMEVSSALTNLPESLSASGERWVEVGEPATNIWYDSNSIRYGTGRRDGREYRSFWVLYNNYGINDKDKILYSLMKKSISCANDTIGDAEAVFYIRGGKIVNRETAFKTRSIKPGTLDRALYRHICN